MLDEAAEDAFEVSHGVGAYTLRTVGQKTASDRGAEGMSLAIGNDVRCPSIFLFMVGVGGLEPPTSWSQTMRAIHCATPRFVFGSPS